MIHLCEFVCSSVDWSICGEKCRPSTAETGVGLENGAITRVRIIPSRVTMARLLQRERLQDLRARKARVAAWRKSVAARTARMLEEEQEAKELAAARAAMGQ